LKRIADITGGRSFRALGQEKDLADVYTTLDKLTPEKIKREIYRPQRDYFWVPVAAGLSILALYHVLALLIAWLRAPRRARGVQGVESVPVSEARHGN
jgi:Ca-activated chloride channel family protein